MRQRPVALIARGAALVVMAIILASCQSYAFENVVYSLTCESNGGTVVEDLDDPSGIRCESLPPRTPPIEDPDVNNCNYNTCSD
jgi:hypothetical protein